MSRIVKGKFNIFDTGRKHHGNFRKYNESNVKGVIESGRTLERINLREALGFLGHGRRTFGKSLTPSEVEVIQTPSGPLIIENIPACLTTDVKFLPGGDIEYTIEVLDTDSGKITQALIDSKIGGFSWATGGKDGGRNSFTALDNFLGFDYVYEVGFNDSRPYNLPTLIGESVGETGRTDYDLIFEAVSNCGIEESKVEAYARSFVSPAFLAAEQMQLNQDLVAENVSLSSEMERLSAEKDNLKKMLSDQSARALHIEEWAKRFNFSIPAGVMESIKNGDSKAELDFISECVTQKDKLNRLPVNLSVSKHQSSSVGVGFSDVDEYGLNANTAPYWD